MEEFRELPIQCSCGETITSPQEIKNYIYLYLAEIDVVSNEDLKLLAKLLEDNPDVESMLQKLSTLEDLILDVSELVSLTRDTAYGALSKSTNNETDILHLNQNVGLLDRSLSYKSNSHLGLNYDAHYCNDEGWYANVTGDRPSGSDPDETYIMYVSPMIGSDRVPNQICWSKKYPGKCFRRLSTYDNWTQVGFPSKVLTESEYELLGDNIDPNVMYFVKEDE